MQWLVANWKLVGLGLAGLALIAIVSVAVVKVVDHFKEFDARGTKITTLTKERDDALQVNRDNEADRIAREQQVEAAMRAEMNRRAAAEALAARYKGLRDAALAALEHSPVSRNLCAVVDGLYPDEGGSACPNSDGHPTP